jgi:hypothetical protein
MGKHLGAVVNPVLEHNDHYLESPFGRRIYKGKEELHNGLDLQYRYPDTQLANNKADNIIAIADGKVTKVTYSSSRGYYVEIKHNATYTSRYLHMKKGSIKVMVNQLVKKGQILGTEGMTGAADGVHLHLAILKNGYFVDPLDYILGNKNIDSNWELGDYMLKYHKYLRSSPEVKASNKVKYKNLTKNAKEKCIKDTLGYAKYKIGAIVNIKEFKYDNKGNLWGRTNTLWLCVEDSSGKQVKKL